MEKLKIQFCEVVGDGSRERPEGSLFSSFYTEM